MLRPTAKNVLPLDDYMLRITFDNGETKLFDAKPFLSGSWYGKLKDPAYFKRVKTNGITIEWPDGQDICPDELYCSSHSIASKPELDELLALNAYHNGEPEYSPSISHEELKKNLDYNSMACFYCKGTIEKATTTYMTDCQSEPG